MFARLRAHDAHEPRRAPRVRRPTRVTLVTVASRATLGAEALRAAAHARRVVDERKAALTGRAGWARRKRIALFHLDGGAHVRTSGIGVSVQTCV